MEKLEFSVSKEWKKFAKNHPWSAFIPEFATDSEGQKFMRKKSKDHHKPSIIYKIKTEDEQGMQTYSCSQCGHDILGVRVAHPMRRGNIPLTGAGKCRYEQVPYCNNCESQPKFNNTPIQEK